jgi:sugar lactone lactonase YvrE
MIRWLAVVAMLAGCFGPATNTCGDGTTCPASKVCSPLGGCAGPDQLAACDGLGDGANCTASEVGDGTGVCESGVCAATAWSPTVLIGGASEAVAISLSGPSGTALDPLGNVYITEPDHNRIWRVDTNGAATIVAGTGQFGFTGDGGPATSAQVGNPAGLAVDGIGNIYIADTSNQRIRRIDASGIITTVVGTGVAGYSGDEQPATSAELSNPSAVAVDGLGNLYIADTNNARIRRVDAITNVITTVAGDGTALAAPQGVAVDIQGNVWIADTGNNVIRELRARPPIALVTVAGTGMAGFSGDGGPAASATFNAPFGITADELGAVYVADRLNNRIRRIDPAGTISTVVGTGTPGFTGDGGPATSAEINDPYGVSVDSTGALYIVDFENNRIRHVDPAGMITTLAGTGLAVATGDGSAATDVLIENPGAVALDSHGNVIIADTSNNRVRRVDAAGVMATIAGTGHGGFTGDGGMATAADVTGPAGITFDGGGNLYFADAGNSCIRRIDTSASSRRSQGRARRASAAMAARRRARCYRIRRGSQSTLPATSTSPTTATRASVASARRESSRPLPATERPGSAAMEERPRAPSCPDRSASRSIPTAASTSPIPTTIESGASARPASSRPSQAEAPLSAMAAPQRTLSSRYRAASRSTPRTPCSSPTSNTSGSGASTRPEPSPRRQAAGSRASSAMVARRSPRTSATPSTLRSMAPVQSSSSTCSATASVASARRASSRPSPEGSIRARWVPSPRRSSPIRARSC